jgi:hypothetical protein
MSTIYVFRTTTKLVKEAKAFQEVRGYYLILTEISLFSAVIPGAP